MVLDWRAEFKPRPLAKTPKGSQTFNPSPSGWKPSPMRSAEISVICNEVTVCSCLPITLAQTSASYLSMDFISLYVKFMLKKEDSEAGGLTPTHAGRALAQQGRCGCGPGPLSCTSWSVDLCSHSKVCTFGYLLPILLVTSDPLTAPHT